MRGLAFASLLVLGCAPHPNTPPPAPLAPSAAIAASHAFFAAVDRRDADALRGLAAPGFAMFEDGSAKDLAALTGGWTKRATPATRTCAKETVRGGASAIVYFGDCREHAPPRDGRASPDMQGWNTIVLVPREKGWAVALWQWQVGGAEADRVTYNDVYSRAVGYTTEPNRLLVETVARATPGAALDLGMGQGRNAIYLAAQGWKVTGVDLSDEGVRAAKAAAAARKLALDAVVANVDDYDLGVERFDLVAMTYAGDARWMERVKRSVRSGGLVVVEHFRKDPRDATSGGFEPGELARLFAGWDVVRDEVAEDTADWTMRKAALVRFVARKRR